MLWLLDLCKIGLIWNEVPASLFLRMTFLSLSFGCPCSRSGPSTEEVLLGEPFSVKSKKGLD
jgi:hypothetical protein